MEPFTKGQVVLFSFPFTDLSSRKLRPCLVLSESFGQDIVLCQITSKQVRGDMYSVDLLDSHFETGYLHQDSLIRCNMLFTADSKQIRQIVGVISKSKYAHVIKTIVILLS